MNTFETWFSRRLHVRKGASASASTGAVIAVAGVALAVMIMELSLVIVTGFKSEIRRMVTGFGAPVSVTAPYDIAAGTVAETFTPSDSLLMLLRRHVPDQYTLAETLRRQAVVKTDSDFAAVEFVARGATHNPAFEVSNLVAGTMPSDTASRPQIAISRYLANRMGLDVGDRPFLYFFVDDDIKARRAEVCGIYSSGFSEYDASVAYTSLPALQGIGRTEQVSTIDIEGVPDDAIDEFAQRLQEALVDDYRSGQIGTVHAVTNIHRSGALYFNWLELLDANVALIFILMLCVAAFTLISSLFIIVLDRIPTIGILRSLGATRGMVSGIFLRLALRLAGLGVLIGNCLGLGFALVQSLWHVIPLSPEMYYLSYVPVEINWWHILALNAGVLAAIWLILILPARYAATVDPAAAMHYE